MNAYYLLLLVNVALGVAGQTLIKWGVDRVGGFALAHWLAFAKASFTNPAILLGEFLYGMSAILWLVVLSKINLSIAYPMLSLGYILVLGISAWLFHEPVQAINIVGVILICGGVVLVSR
ncbi:MAG TPA: hypothetical protein PKL83_06870 [bacterium]|nr:hypothetical protein [bacterium]